VSIARDYMYNINREFDIYLYSNDGTLLKHIIPHPDYKVGGGNSLMLRLLE